MLKLSSWIAEVMREADSVSGGFLEELASGSIRAYLVFSVILRLSVNVFSGSLLVFRLLNSIRLLWSANVCTAIIMVMCSDRRRTANTDSDRICQQFSRTLNCCRSMTRLISIVSACFWQFSVDLLGR